MEMWLGWSYTVMIVTVSKMEPEIPDSKQKFKKTKQKREMAQQLQCFHGGARWVGCKLIQRWWADLPDKSAWVW